MVGVVETPDAIKKALEMGLDLVEISPDARPPVCKIMDFGKFKYQESKKEQKNRAASKASELKEVRLGRSVKIDPHDVSIRVKQSRQFLLDGHKVLITQRFKGREMAHRELGINRLNEIIKELSDVAKLERPPSWMGPQASIILSPDKAKIDVYKRQHKITDKPKPKAKDDDHEGGGSHAERPAGKPAKAKAEAPDQPAGAEGPSAAVPAPAPAPSQP
jgi:translation initiation factor IF-3